jgi:hypothetical protein
VIIIITVEFVFKPFYRIPFPPEGVIGRLLREAK